MTIYVDNAATTKMSKAALDAMLPYLREHYGNPSSLHAAGRRARQALDDARQRVAACIGCRPDEVYFTCGGSESDTQAILSAARIGEREGKRHILSTVFEHHAVLHTLAVLEKQGFEVELLDVHAHGNIDVGQVDGAIREDTCLVTAMYANNEIGSVLPIAEIGRVCKQRGVLLHTDAVQAAGYLPIDVMGQGIDLLSLSAHKFGGPKGAGVLYARRGVDLISLIYGGAQEQGRRAGTENLPAIMGMAAALELANAQAGRCAKRISALRDALIEGLSAIPHSALNGDAVKRLPGNVNFCFEGIEGESLLLLLNMKGIQASSGSACASGNPDPSHVLLALGRPRELAQASLRITLGPDNTAEEVAYILQTVPPIVERLRAASAAWQDKVLGKVNFLL